MIKVQEESRATDDARIAILISRLFFNLSPDRLFKATWRFWEKAV